MQKGHLGSLRTARTADSIQPLSISAGPSRTYANMVANVVCVSLHPRTHGEGEGLTASSPAEPVGRRRDPMGHLPFWQEYIEEMNPKGYGNLFGN